MAKYANSGGPSRPVPLAAAIAGGLLGSGLQAATIEVNATGDAPPGQITDQCLLRDAIYTAASGIDQGGCELAGDPTIEEVLIDMSSLSGQIELGEGQIEAQIHDLELRITGPGPETLTIQADESARIFWLDGHLSDTTLTLEGLSLTHGNADYGGALHFRGRHLTLNNMTISGNASSGKGGGVNAILHLEEVDLLPDRKTLGLRVENSLISGNSASDDGGGIQAELYAYESAGVDLELVLTDSVIENNLTQGSRGGGINVSMESKYGTEDAMEILVAGNKFTNNKADLGGGLQLEALPNETDVENVNITIRDNQFISNDSNQSGGGLRLRLDWSDGGLVSNSSISLIELNDNYFEDNRAAASGGGASIRASISNESRPELNFDSSDNTFKGNRANAGGGLEVRGLMWDNVSPSFDSRFTLDLTSTRDLFINNLATEEGTNTRAGAASLLIRNTVALGPEPENLEAQGPTTLTLDAITVIDNSSDSSAGGIWVDSPQDSDDEILIKASTLGNNQANSDGGALHLTGPGQVNLINSTISDNLSGGEGGGVWMVDVDEVEILHSTLADNEAASSGGGIHIKDALVFDIDHSIVAGNLAGDAGADLNNTDANDATLRWSLIGDTTDASLIDIEGNLLDINPQLAPLSDNGGINPTREPPPGSPAFNAGDPDLDPIVEYDQRGPGFPRILGPAPNMGAIETERVFSDRFKSQ